MTSTINCGFSGFGHMGAGHQLIISLHPGLRGRLKIKAAFDPDPGVREKAAKRKIRVYEDFQSLLDSDGLDAIVVASPPQYHCDQVVAALEAGYHVYSEIPMALSFEEIDRIIAAEESSGKVYQCGENYAFFAEVLYAAYLVSSGKIGRPVYAEAEYLHDVTYRWRQGGHGGPETPRVESWYSRFDPLMYAHSIGPAQVAIGGLGTPASFVEVSSYANDLGGDSTREQPVCAPARAFHVALFRTADDVIVKCANAYVFAREPYRMNLQIAGELGTFEVSRYGKGGRLFLADDHVITRSKHRKGRATRVGRWQLRKVASHGIHPFIAANVRILRDWLDAIETGRKPALHARAAANACAAGIAASKSARSGDKQSIPVYD